MLPLDALLTAARVGIGVAAANFGKSVRPYASGYRRPGKRRRERRQKAEGEEGRRTEEPKNGFTPRSSPCAPAAPPTDISRAVSRESYSHVPEGSGRRWGFVIGQHVSAANPLDHFVEGRSATLRLPIRRQCPPPKVHYVGVWSGLGYMLGVGGRARWRVRVTITVERVGLVELADHLPIGELIAHAVEKWGQKSRGFRPARGAARIHLRR